MKYIYFKELKAKEDHGKVFHSAVITKKLHFLFISKSSKLPDCFTYIRVMDDFLAADFFQLEIT